MSTEIPNDAVRQRSMTRSGCTAGAMRSGLWRCGFAYPHARRRGSHGAQVGYSNVTWSSYVRFAVSLPPEADISNEYVAPPNTGMKSGGSSLKDLNATSLM